MEFINANDLPAAGTMGTDNKVIVQQGDKFVLMTLAELLEYVASASVNTDTTLTLEGVAAEALATGKAFRAARAVNLLDNSDFTNPVNQRGKTDYSGASGYSIDRWKVTNMVRVELLDTCAKLTCTSASTANGFSQAMEKPPAVGASVTFAAMEDSGVLHVGSVNVPASGSAVAFTTDTGVTGRVYTDKVAIMIPGGESISLKWAALYMGTYTAETLPEYQPKGYAAELQECRRYYRQSWYGAIDDMTASGSVPFIRSKGGANTQMAVNWHDPMRITPTIEIYSPGTKAKNYIRDWVGSTDKPVGGAGYASHYGFCLVLKDSGTTEGTDYVFHYTASADL